MALSGVNKTKDEGMIPIRHYVVLALALLIVAVGARPFAAWFDGVIYPPMRVSTVESLAVLAPQMVPNPHLGSALPWIEYSLYFLILIVIFYRLVLALRPYSGLRSVEQAVDSSAGHSSALDMTAGRHNDIAATIRIERTTMDGLTLTDRANSHAKALAKTTVDRQKELARTQALDILKTISDAAHARKTMAETPAVKPRIDGSAPKMINDRYRVHTALASGGAGVVYKGFDTQLKRVVAMKQLFPDLSVKDKHAQRFIDEAQALATLSHPNIVPIYDIAVGEEYWFIMEFLGGGSLQGRVEEHGYLDATEALGIMLAVSTGLAAAHRKGLTHRDIKPHNILFTDDGEVKIADFGIAKSDESTLETTVGVILGSPAYLSPEQAVGETVTPKTDIYALGVTAYQILTGEMPYTGSVQEVLNKHVTQTPEPLTALNPDISEDINNLVLCMMSKSPDDRCSAEEAVKALSEILMH